ncbi:hypothetical protein [uncultured Jannaschia sp.]|uniref:hypothetical protein n=1 Tax=uncultured Jannaschia sp. TaxID=293347 RepID=UPI002619F97C|nr:hypothetical protein [uncultured Jannaschia sp.]
MPTNLKVSFEMSRQSEASANEAVFESVMGHARTPARLSREEYRVWLDRIRGDHDLIRDLFAIRSGTKLMEDLDEGDAGIFAGRIFPETELTRITEKLDHIEPRSRAVIVAALLSRVLTDLHSIPSEHGSDAPC